MRLGKPAPRFDDVPQRVRQEAVVAIGQRKLLQRLGPGIMHALIFWGFIVLFPTIIMAMIAAVDRDATLPWLGHQGWFALLVDLFAVLVLLSVCAAFFIRKCNGRCGSGQPHGRGRLHPGDDRGHRQHLLCGATASRWA
jgi:hypothetical protein